MSKRILFSRMRRSIFFMTGFIGVCIMLFACYVLPRFLPWDPVSNSLLDKFIPPQGFAAGLSGHVLGTDLLGRDMLTRLLVGGQYSIRIAITSVFLQSVIGVVMGILAGYFGGLINAFIMRLCDVLIAIPALIMSIAIMAVLGASERNLIFVLTFSGWVVLCKVIRNDVSILKRQEFVMASKAIGSNGFDIMFRQILPNTTTNMIIISSQRFGVMILIEASLSFLGLGVLPPAPSWGNMISAGRSYLVTNPWMIIVPGIGLMLTVLSFNFLGDGIRDVLDTKRKV